MSHVDPQHAASPPTPRVPPPSRPFWVWAIITAYVLAVATLLATPWILGWTADNYIGIGPVIITTGIWLLLLAGLMFVPIQVRRQRPITRATIWIPLAFTGLLAGLVVAMIGLALWELTKFPADLQLALWAAGLATWALWAGLFYLVARRQGYTTIGLVLHRWLLAGTILELLIAVPSHIIVRRRTDCCAGMMTGTAICIGVLVAVLAFGPGIALLYLRRWRQLQIPEQTRGFEITLITPPGTAAGPDTPPPGVVKK